MKKKGVLWGLLFILAAVLIILNQLGFFAETNMFEIVATVLLSGIIIVSITKINFWGILFPLAFIAIIFDKQLNITEFTPWPALLTALLFSIGLSLIFNRPKLGIAFMHFDDSFSSNVINEQDDNVINCSTNFGENIKYVNSENFERANIRCSFGETKLYFDNAQIPSGRAEIYVDVSFGEAQLFIPKSWKVVNDIHVFLGDVREMNRNNVTDSPVVTLRGSVNLGDIKIIYV